MLFNRLCEVETVYKARYLLWTNFSPETIAAIQECECKDAIASLIRKTNAILAALRAVGIIATE